MVPFARNGLQNGLVLVVDTETFDYTFSASSGEGLVLSLMHHVSSGQMLYSQTKNPKVMIF
jgi:hypothetical protein